MVIDTKNYNWSMYRKQETGMVSPKQNIHIRPSLPRLKDHSLQRQRQKDCKSQTCSLMTNIVLNTGQQWHMIIHRCWNDRYNPIMKRRMGRKSHPLLRRYLLWKQIGDGELVLLFFFKGVASGELTNAPG